MSDVVDLRPAQSVQFEGEMQVLADRLTGMLDMIPGLLRGTRSKKPQQQRMLIRAAERVIRIMDTIDTHVALLEKEMTALLKDVEDGEMVKFQTYDERLNALVTSTLVTRCHTVRISSIRFDAVMNLAHDNDDFLRTSLRPRLR